MPDAAPAARGAYRPRRPQALPLFRLGPAFVFAPIFRDPASGSGWTTAFTGAQLSVVDDDLAQSLGIEPSVSVMRVLPRTPRPDCVRAM